MLTREDEWEIAGMVYDFDDCGMEALERLYKYVESLVSKGQAEERERLCLAIKMADDRASEADYMLDSDDCIKVIKGWWHND